MKVFFLVLFLISFRSHATGCLGGHWYTISNDVLAPTEILTTHYGEARFEVITWSKSSASVRMYNVGTKSQKLEFRSGLFSTDKIDLQELLLSLKDLKPSFLAATTRKIETNEYYDDCEDIPEGTIRTTHTYKVVVRMKNGQAQELRAEVMTEEDPPTSGGTYQ